MAKNQWLERHPGMIPRVIMVLLILLVVLEGFFLFQERTINRKASVESGKLLGAFLHEDTTEASRAPGVAIRLQNVRFKWSDKVHIDAVDMAVRAVPIQGNVVDFDDPKSFLLKLQQSRVAIPPDVLEGMFNESVFNYPDSKLRNMKVTLSEEDSIWGVRLTGSVKMGVWIPFTMFTHLSIDKSTNTMAIDVNRLQVMGAIPATSLIRWKPLQLEKMITLPPNQMLMVQGNRILVKPFALFPPPRVSGTMSDLSIDSKVMRLGFSGSAIPAPKVAAQNYVYLKGGVSQFGNFRLLDTDVVILDKNPATPFSFSLLSYAGMIPKSAIDIHDTKSVRITMPDF